MTSSEKQTFEIGGYDVVVTQLQGRTSNLVHVFVSRRGTPILEDVLGLDDLMRHSIRFCVERKLRPLLDSSKPLGLSPKDVITY